MRGTLILGSIMMWSCLLCAIRWAFKDLANAIIIGLKDLAPRHVSKPNQQWWINVILLCISSYSLSIYSPALHSHLPIHKSLFIPPSTFLSSVNLILLNAIAELFRRCSTDSVMSNSTVQAHKSIQTDLPGRGVHQWLGAISCTNRVRISGIIKTPKP